MSTVEVVSTDAIGHGEWGDEWGVPDVVRWVGKSFDVLNDRIITRSIPLIP